MESKRDKLIEATKSLLWEVGYESMSPKTILKRSGAGQGSLYHHFEGKKDNATSQPKIVPNSEKWRKYFNVTQLKKLEKIAGKTLEDFGYETIYEQNDIDPANWKLKYWVFVNYIRRGIAEFGIQLRKNKNRRWRFLFLHLINALKQRKTTRF